MAYKLLLLAAVLIVAFGCLSSENAVQELQFFELDDKGDIITTEGNMSYILLTPDESIPAAKADRIVDFQAGEVMNLDGSSEELKPLDTLSFGNMQVRRYIYGMGRVDGLSLLGVSENHRILFVINPTWKSGAATLDFIEKYKTGIYQKNVLTLSLPPPPLPEAFE